MLAKRLLNVLQCRSLLDPTRELPRQLFDLLSESLGDVEMSEEGKQEEACPALPQHCGSTLRRKYQNTMKIRRPNTKIKILTPAMFFWHFLQSRLDKAQKKSSSLLVVMQIAQSCKADQGQSSTPE